MAQWQRFVSERDVYRFAARHLRAAFPGLPDRSQFNRLLRPQQSTLAQFAVWLTTTSAASRYEILEESRCRPAPINARDAAGCPASPILDGIPVRLVYRAPVAPGDHPAGRSTGFGVGPARANDRQLTEMLLALGQHPDPALPSVGGPGAAQYLADTGVGAADQGPHWFTHDDATMICPPQRGRHRRWSRSERRPKSRRRQLVETTIGRLLDTFPRRAERPHSLSGSLARIADKVTFYNFAIQLNQHAHRPLLAFVDLIAW